MNNKDLIILLDIFNSLEYYKDSPNTIKALYMELYKVLSRTRYTLSWVLVRLTNATGIRWNVRTKAELLERIEMLGI